LLAVNQHCVCIGQNVTLNETLVTMNISLQDYMQATLNACRTAGNTLNARLHAGARQLWICKTAAWWLQETLNARMRVTFLHWSWMQDWM